jgi:anti-sigma regulatory factor (Ser/Thr protein kinase)
LVAFGFPIEKVDEAFGIVAPPKTIPAVAIGGVGLVVVTASVAAMLYGRWAVRNKMWR